MKAILEKIGHDKYLEFVLSDREIKLISSYHLITCNVPINGKIYHVGIRSLALREKEEEEENATY
jgi:hypothetical protein